MDLLLQNIKKLYPIEYVTTKNKENMTNYDIEYDVGDYKIVLTIYTLNDKIKVTLYNNKDFLSSTSLVDTMNIILAHYLNIQLSSDDLKHIKEYEKTIAALKLKHYIPATKLNNEYEVFNQIKLGNRKQLIENFYRSKAMREPVILSKNSRFDHKRNLLIVNVSLATRYAIAGKVPQKEAYFLSDNLIRQIDSNKYFDHDVDHSLNIMLKFCDLVIKHNKINLTRPIRSVKEHIENNLYAKINLDDLARVSNYSKTYLSKRFKQELNMTITDYIHESKIDEAKFLIKTSNHSLSSIAQLLNFSDYSHFIRVFKKSQNVTPYEYQSRQFFIK